MLVLTVAMTLAAATLAGAQDRDVHAIIADTQPRQQAYRKCLAEKTVELGAGNSESAETILRAVASACLPQETALRALYAETPIGGAHTEKLMQRDKKLGEDVGVAALLEVRAKRAD